MSVVLGLDIGTAKTGVAIGNTETGFAWPRPALFGDIQTHLDALRELVTTEHVDRIVVGLPLSTDGEENEQSTYTREQAALLEQALGIEIELHDERFSSQGVLRQHQGQSLKRGAEDSLSAVAVVESCL